ncbi:MAG: hypothetical protein KJI71_01385 [Patescibacteria group bacterium]|nr:hypothetical protein [Patescibacteria group bacterium]
MISHEIAKNYINQKIRQYTILSIYRFDKKKGADCRIRCECGKKHYAYLDTIINNKQRNSCNYCPVVFGKYTNKGYRSLYNHYKRTAKKRGHVFKIDFSQFLSLIDKDCSICEASLSNLYTKSGNQNYQLKYNGIDRIDSKKGYIKGNVQTLCYVCNTMKMNFDLETIAEKAPLLGIWAEKELAKREIITNF